MSEREVMLPPAPDDFEYYGEEPEGRPLHEYVAGIFGKIGLLWAHRGWILRRTIGAMVVALGLAFLLPNWYTATVYINPPDANPLSGLSLLIGMKDAGGGAGLGSSVSSALGLKDAGQLYVQQAMSRVVMDRIIARFDLQKVYRTSNLTDTRKALDDHTDVEEDRKSSVISIAVEDKDPKRAAAMANAFADELGRLIANVNSASGRREREYFQTQLVSAQADLEQASKQLSEFGSKTTTLNVEDQGKALVDAVSSLEGQLVASESELRALQQIYTDKHERVQQVQAKIAVLRQQLAQISGKQPPANAGSADASNALDPSVKRLWGLSVPYMDLYRKVKIDEAVVETLTQQYELAKLQEERKITDLQVYDPADVPDKKSSPHRGIITLAVGMLAFLFTAGFVLADSWWHETDPQDPWRVLLEPVVSKLGRAKLRFGRDRIPLVRALRKRPDNTAVEEQRTEE